MSSRSRFYLEIAVKCDILHVLEGGDMKKSLAVAILLVVSLLLASREKECHWTSLSGREFFFKDLCKSQQDYGYRWTKNPRRIQLRENG